MSKFKGELSEGKVYKIVYFHVVYNGGSFRASPHEYKIVFNGRTKVVPDQSDVIPMNGLLLKNSEEIALTLGESDFLVGKYRFHF